MYADCTRLDEALKKGEMIHSKDTDSSKNSYQRTDTAHKYSDNYSSNARVETSGSDWNNYDYGQGWDYSQHHPEENSSTKDPYRQNMESKPEASSDRETTGN